MSTSDEQPLTRRQIRERERAREAGRAVAEGTAGGAPVEGSTPGSAAAPVAASVPASAPQADAAPVPTAAPVPASAPTPPPASVAGPDGLTRRQMRAQRAEQTGPSAPVPLQTPGPEPRRRLVDALSTVDEIVAPLDESAPASARQSVGDHSSGVPSATAESGAGAVSDADAEGRAPGPRRTGQPSPTPTPTSAEPAAAPTSAPSVFPLDLAESRPASASTPVDGDPGVSSSPTASSASGSVAEPAPASAPEPSGFVPPVGHWTTQSDEPDGDTAPGRALGTHTGQTNALILTDQQVADVTGALNATGEIIITGSIDLPRSLGATGSQARIDNSDIDRLLEQGDAESAETDAAPVRASRAISTHTSTRSVVLAASQPASSKVPLILGIGGGILGAGIIGVVIAGFATGILGG
ncbi:hypothetical protein ES689_11745 [Frigoribacterium sp. ACAM 257]|uniref:hypothetical protein n=1 Tax=Frigoribacterium sp. ACAM 257 TaxID=2508998 RepID=UPI0011B9CDDF|nr:hypothetical protein [Frigoribacterium sp. ACAM 257]TWX37313.1 hypothetical protein ES689_11745 [Frigoribacterium sp. ACAM 257]